MKKAIMFLVTLIGITCIGQIQTVHAADMGGQLKLKDDSKQELKEIMKSIKKIAAYSFEYTSKSYPNKHYSGDQVFNFSGCNVKTDKGQSVNKDFDHDKNQEYSLSNIELVEIQMDSDTGNNANIILNTKDFEKKVFARWLSYRHDPTEKYIDYAELLVPESNATVVIELLEKAIKLCGDK